MQYRSGTTVEIVHVSGRKKGTVMLYALSTCVWCKKTKELLASMGVEHDYLFVDLLPEKEMEQVMEQVMKFNPKGSFPTLVIDGKKCIVGFREAEIREALA
jgi:glutaredoxin